MKKLIIVAFSVVLAVALAACSAGKIAEPSPTQGIAEDMLDTMTETPAPTEVPVVTPTPDILDATAEPTEMPAAE